jgi:hypothetical protein
MSNVAKPEANALILIAVMNNPRDFGIARMLGWYRIPLRSAPKIIAVDYLAFYFTKAFEEYKWQIRYIAPILGHELMTRAELLLDEPDHPSARQEYYKIQIGTLVELPKPIQSQSWRRITFLYTTGEHLMNASDINELILSSEERPVIWQALRERANNSQFYKVEEINADEQLLAILLGIQNLAKVEK